MEQAPPSGDSRSRYSAWRRPRWALPLAYLGALVGPLVIFKFGPLSFPALAGVIVGIIPSAIAIAMLDASMDARTRDEKGFPRSVDGILNRDDDDWARARKRAALTALTLLGAAILMDWVGLRHVWLPLPAEDN